MYTHIPDIQTSVMGANCSTLVFHDENLTEYVDNTMGPKCIGQTMIICTFIVYCTLFLVGTFGNILIVLVVVKNRAMHTATNYYLLSLAVSDLLSLVLGMFFVIISKV